MSELATQLSPAVVDRIMRLKRQGWDARMIAQELEISRDSVLDVFYPARHEREDISKPRDRRPQRCPGCGGMVQMPCRHCKLESQLADRSRQERRLDRMVSNSLDIYG